MTQILQTAAPGNVCAAIDFTIVHSETGRLTKAYGYDFKKGVVTEPAPPLAKGSAHRITLKGAPDQMAEVLAQHVKSLSSSQAIITAPLRAGKDVRQLVTAKEAEGSSEVIARTKRHFQPARGPALLGLDFDFKTYPEAVIARIEEAGGLPAVLASVCPGIGGAACVRRHSVSTGIAVLGEEPSTRPTGAHWYFFILDGEDAPDFAQRLFDRLALAGWSWGEVSENGLVLPRGLFDLAASCDPSRLFYEADAVLTSPELERVKGARDPKVIPGDFLDTRALPVLIEDERARLESIKAEIKRDLESECRKKRERWKAERIEQMIRKGKSPEAARKAVAGAVERHVLTGDWEVHLDDGRLVTAREILENPAAYHKRTCADPLEPEYRGGRNIAVIYGDKHPVRIRSQAHSGIDYRLEQSPDEWFEPIDEAEANRLAELGGLFGESAPNGDEAGSGKRTFKPYTAGESARLALSKRAKPLVERLLDCGALSVIYGAPGVGKSFVMLDMAYRIAAGIAHGPRRVTKGPVVYVAAEGGGGIHARVKALVDTHGERDGEGLPVPFFVLPERVNLRDRRADLAPFLEMLRDVERQAGKIVLIVIDTLARSMGGGDENSPVDMGAMVEHFDKIRAATGAHVAVVHHTGKDAARGMRGHSSLLGAIDTELEVSEGVVKSEKQRDMESGEEFGYRLRTVALGIDEDGRPMQSAVADIQEIEREGEGQSGRTLTPQETRVRDICCGLEGTFSCQDICDMLEGIDGRPPKHNSVRTILNTLRLAGEIEKAGRGSWRRRADKLSDQQSPEGATNRV